MVLDGIEGFGEKNRTYHIFTRAPYSTYLIPRSTDAPTVSGQADLALHAAR